VPYQFHQNGLAMNDPIEAGKVMQRAESSRRPSSLCPRQSVSDRPASRQAFSQGLP